MCPPHTRRQRGRAGGGTSCLFPTSHVSLLPGLQGLKLAVRSPGTALQNLLQLTEDSLLPWHSRTNGGWERRFQSSKPWWHQKVRGREVVVNPSISGNLPTPTPPPPHLPPPSFCLHRSRGKLPVVGVGGIHCSGNGYWTVIISAECPAGTGTLSPTRPVHSLLWLQAEQFPAQPEQGLGIFPWFLLLIYCAFPGTIWGWEPGSNNAESL